MASNFSLLVVLVSILGCISAQSAFTDLLGSAESCEQKCTISYAPHTYPNGEENNACQRGCRLYTVSKFISSDEPRNFINSPEDGRSHALVLCERSCLEAYGEESTLKDACQIGCVKEEAEISKPKEVEPEEPSAIMRPVMEVREISSRVIGMLKVMQSSIVTFFRGEGEEMVAVRGPVRITVSLNDPAQSKENILNQALENAVETPEQNIENEIQASEIRDTVLKVPIKDESSSFTKFYQSIGQQDIIHYVILVAMFLCGIFLVYVLFSRQSRSIKKKALKLKSEENNGMPPAPLPVKFVLPEDLTKLSLDEEEAPPLPTKVKLPDNTIV